MDETTTERMAIIGSGGHASVLADIVYGSKWELLGYIDHEERTEGIFRTVKYLGDDELFIEKHSDENINVANGLGWINDPQRRKDIAEEYREEGFHFPPLISGEAYIASDVTLSDGVQAMANSVIHPGASVGANTVVNTGAIVEHDCEVGPDSQLSPGAVLCGKVKVGAQSMIGAGAVVKEDLTIGSNTIIGAGAVVIDDVPSNVTAVGVPAREK